MSSRQLLYTALITMASSPGYVASLSYPPYIANRECNAPMSSTALMSDCQTAINNLASQTGYINGPTKGCLEAATSGTCGVTLCAKVNIDPVAVAVAAQDVIAGCEDAFTGSGVNQVVYGTIQMNGFTNGNGGANGLFNIFVGKSGVAGSPGDSKLAVGDSSGNSSTPSNTVPTATAQPHGKRVGDLIVPTRIEAREAATLVQRTPAPAPTWIVGTEAPGIVLRVMRYETGNWVLTPTQADALAFGVTANWHNQAPTD